MKELRIKVDCGLETCEQCEFVEGFSPAPICGFFRKLPGCKNADLVRTPGHRTFFRLPECIAWEAKNAGN